MTGVQTCALPISATVLHNLGKCCNDRDELEEEIREAYVDHSPEEIAHKAIEIVREVVSQHAARQQANSVNRGTFAWSGISVELTVPQLRTLQSAHVIFSELVRKLPRRNPKLVYNVSIDNRPAFAHIKQKHEKIETRYTPYEEEASNRIRTYSLPTVELDINQAR